MAETEYGKDELLNEVRMYVAVWRNEKRNPNAMDVDGVSHSRASRNGATTRAGSSVTEKSQGHESARLWSE